MIDLRCSRAELLASIGAPEPLGEPLSDPADPRVATSEAYLRLRANDPDHLFPVLKVAVSERFPSVPPLPLVEDFLMPLRNAIGNAFRHGNGGDPSRSILLEVVFTTSGAFAAVSDEGPGFDPALTFDRLRQNERYFENYGAGFLNFHRTVATTVSYEDGGRTVLLCYRPRAQEAPARPSSPEGPSAGPAPVAPAQADEDRLLRRVLDPEWMRACLSAELPEFRNGGVTLDSCRPCARKPGEAGHTYVLRVAGRDAIPRETRLLTGRLCATRAVAAADFTAATRLYQAWESKGVLIPRPVARLFAEPRLVLYDFMPWMNLRDYFAFFTSRGGMSSVRHTVGRIGHLLATLHRCDVPLPAVDPRLPDEPLPSAVAGLERKLHALPGGEDLARRFCHSVRRVQEGVSSRRAPMLAAVHGTLDWDCIYYGVDNCFYLYRFEGCRRSDPRLDVGRFLAHLLWFTQGEGEVGAFGTFVDDFLRGYNSLAPHPLEKRDLPHAMVIPLLEGLDRMPPRMDSHATRLLAAVDVVSRLTEAAAD